MSEFKGEQQISIRELLENNPEQAILIIAEFVYEELMNNEEITLSTSTPLVELKQYYSGSNDDGETISLATKEAIELIIMNNFGFDKFEIISFFADVCERINKIISEKAS